MSNIKSREALLGEIRALLEKGGNDNASMQAVLEKLLEAFACPVGTIHALDAQSGMLKLRARRGIPDIILDKVTMIEIGKGMAGIAAERMQPVQVCNLQTDVSGVAKPGAKETRMEGSISVPMILQSIAYQNNGLLIIMWDEGASSSDGPIGMIVLSPLGKGAGYHNAVRYTHSSTLRTLQK